MIFKLKTIGIQLVGGISIGIIFSLQGWFWAAVILLVLKMVKDRVEKSCSHEHKQDAH